MKLDLPRLSGRLSPAKSDGDSRSEPGMTVGVGMTMGALREIEGGAAKGKAGYESNDG